MFPFHFFDFFCLLYKDLGSDSSFPWLIESTTFRTWGGPQIVLLRRPREGKRVRKETIANLTRVNRREKRTSSEV